MEAVESDSEAKVTALLPNPPLEAITLARERGVSVEVKLLLPEIELEAEEEKEALPTLLSSWTGYPGVWSSPTTQRGTN